MLYSLEREVCKQAWFCVCCRGLFDPFAHKLVLQAINDKNNIKIANLRVCARCNH